ncbi:hypothetical protein OIU85_010044 [Salix viminalis]|uniref:Uncharacterized protein n=1 Tax=Salix viminalis TaxID=40686 RepID=A0A9Q0NVR5_SALVM|nr:hypothetical protein OIU85_010044 [Salix viminalis]
MAPPHGLQLSIFRSMRYVSMPPLANVSAAAPPAGPPPMTATLRLRFWSLGLDLLAVIRKRRYGNGELGVVWGWINFGCSTGGVPECGEGLEDNRRSHFVTVDSRGSEPSSFASSSSSVVVVVRWSVKISCGYDFGYEDVFAGGLSK